jgi:hypothetical protein
VHRISDPILKSLTKRHVEKALLLLVQYVAPAIHNTFDSCSCICTTHLQKDVSPVTGEITLSYSKHHNNNDNNSMPIGTTRTAKDVSLSSIILVFFIFFSIVVHDTVGFSVWHTAHSHQEIHS